MVKTKPARQPSTFAAQFRREVSTVARREKISQSRAFVIWFSQIFFELNDEEALDATATEGPNDKKIDLFYIDHDDGKVIIAQGKHSATGQYRPKLSEVDALHGSLNWLASPNALRNDGRADLAAKAEEYLEVIKDGYGVELWFAYAGPKCANVEKHIAVYNQNQENVDAHRSCRNCDLPLLQMYFEASKGHSRRLEQETIRLVDKKHFKYQADFGEALVGTVPATELIRLHKKYQDQLFERNVRLFLGARKGSINAGIAETLKSDAKANFWAYNNGLTFVCSSFESVPGSVTVNDFCIVNGCQSTRSLVDQEASVDESVTALVRFLAVSDDLVDEVIRYTNSQNPIRAWDLASVFKTQRRLKKEFNELSKPWIYLTRRGDQPKGSADRYKNGGKPRLIKLAEVGQYVAALAGYPVMAYKNKAFIYSKRHDDVFPHDIKVEEVLFAWICGQEVHEAVGQRRKDTADEVEKSILIKGGSLFTMAVLGEIARQRNGSTYLKTLNEEQIVSKAGKERFKKYALYSLECYLSAVKDAMEGSNTELPTAIRSPDFFKKVRDRVQRKYRTDALGGEAWLKHALPKLVQ